MKCDIKNREQWISGYLTGSLTNKEIADFEEHYFQCDTCFKALRVAEDAMGLIENEGPALWPSRENWLSTFISANKEKLAVLGKRRWRIPIAAVGAAFVIFIVIIISLDNKGINQFSGPTFEPQPYLEQWISDNTRSGGQKLEVVISPQIGKEYENEEIVFQWKMIERIPVTLKIMNNLEKEVFNSSADLTQFPDFKLIVVAKTLKESGLYYWKIEDENDVLFVGKFYFLK